ncbi:hypothetical protein NQD34_004120 [Periophthalmus magnuspinnatus]|nr:hypothetical protein NQD34_004120 [Periophthalmus magnuspinnatus]
MSKMDLHVCVGLVLLLSLLSFAHLSPLTHTLHMGQSHIHTQLQTRVKRDKPQESQKTVTGKQREPSGCQLSTCAQHHLPYALYILQQERLKDKSPPEGKMEKYGRRRRRRGV